MAPSVDGTSGIKLNDGAVMPRLGLGVWQMTDAVAASAVRSALEIGYRLIDTASQYHNEVGAGQGVAQSGLPREALFITTKLPSDQQGYSEALKGCEESLSRLGTSYVDLYLIHWPAPMRGRYVETWKALIRLQEEGMARSIGVSNFTVTHLENIMAATGVAPAVNQIELHPRFQQSALRQFHAANDIVTESWSPLGQGTLLNHPVLSSMAESRSCTPAQIILRWHVQNGMVAIPKTVSRERMSENYGCFNFALEAEELEKIATLDSADGRIGPDPHSFE